MLNSMKAAVHWLLNEPRDAAANQDFVAPAALQALREALADLDGTVPDDLALTHMFRTLPTDLQWLARRYGRFDQFVATEILSWLEDHADPLAQAGSAARSPLKGAAAAAGS